MCENRPTFASYKRMYSGTVFLDTLYIHILPY